jgi:hypothetical protein
LIQDPNVSGSGTGSTPLWRTIAYNPFSNHVYIVTRTNQTGGSVNPSGLAIWALNADTGADLFQLQTNGIPGDNSTGGTFPLVALAVSDDGSIYGANVVSAANASTAPLRIYRWSSGNSALAPVQVYAGDPGTGVITGKRWGDTLTVRGSGAGTQILLDCNTLSVTAILTPTDAFLTNFTSVAYNNNYTGTTLIGRGSQFGPTNTVFLKKTGPTSQPLDLIRLDSNPSTTILLSSGDYFYRVGTLAVDLARNIAVGIYSNSPAVPDRLLVFDISNFNAPVQIARYDFPINHIKNANNIGQVVIAKSRIFAIDGNNGIMMVPEPPLTQPVLTLSQANNKVVLSWPTPVPNYTLQYSTGVSPTSWNPLGPITTIGSQNYVTNNIDSSAKFYRLNSP